MTKECERTRELLCIALGLDPKVTQPGETQDKPTVNFHVADSGEIQIFATRVPLIRAVMVLQVLNGQWDEWLVKTFKAT